MSHSLPVRQRPRRFADVSGQQAAVDVLSAAAASEKVAQQYLLAGPSGVGKTTLARIFAAALFCSSPQVRPIGTVEGREACGVCESCEAVVGPGGRHPDVVEIDAASYGGVDQVRQLAEKARLAPLLADRKIYVVDEAHGLTRDGGQAFLKLLEEPPSHVIFLLATTDPQKLPTALRGRCVQVYVSAPEVDDLVANLRRVCGNEGWDISEDVLELVVAATDADLGVRGSVATLEKLASLATGAGPVGTREAAAVLGIADPEAAHALTSCIRVGDRAGALGALDVALGAGSLSLVTAQLSRWAHGELRSAVREGRDEAQPLWWLEQISDPQPWPLPVRVARMCDPGLGGAAGLAALTARAEELVDELASLTTAPRLVARGTGRLAPTTSAAASPEAPSTPQPPPAAAAAAPAPAPQTPPAAVLPQPETPTPSAQPPAQPPAPAAPAATPKSAADASPPASAAPAGSEADRIALLNLIGRHGGGSCALAARRGTIEFGTGGVRVSAADPDGRVAAAVTAAAAELGWPVTFAGR